MNGRMGGCGCGDDDNDDDDDDEVSMFQGLAGTVRKGIVSSVLEGPRAHVLLTVEWRTVHEFPGSAASAWQVGTHVCFSVPVQYLCNPYISLMSSMDLSTYLPTYLPR